MFCGTTGIARDVLAEMARDHPPIGVIAAAGAVADDQREAFAAVEVGDRIGVRGRSRSDERDRENRPDMHHGPRGEL
jgi:hypothetical protein